MCGTKKVMTLDAYPQVYQLLFLNTYNQIDETISKKDIISKIPLMKSKDQATKNIGTKCINLYFKTSYKSIRKNHYSPSRKVNNEQVGKGLTTSQQEGQVYTTEIDHHFHL